MSIFQVFTKDCKPDNDKIVLRAEQNEAIELAEKAFAEKNFSTKKTYLKFLWNAKMRFGKTLCALQLAKKMGFKRTLIVTHRPVVDQGWEEDFHKTFEDCSAQYRYGRKSNDYAEGNFYDLEKFVKTDGNHYVFFVSMQYLRLSALVRQNGDHDKLKEDILNNNWDFVVVDEAHEGTQTNLGEKVIQHLSKAGSRVLHLSGTPFNLYDDFADGEIFTWDYIAEQTAKAKWEQDHPLEFNPYQDLPRMKIYTYDLGKLIKGEGLVSEDAEFKFSEFFRTWTGNPKADANKDNIVMPEGAKGRFIYEDKVNKFLDLLCSTEGENNYPFSTEEYQESFKHTLWVVPGVKEAKALEKLLGEHEVFANFTIINVAGKNEDDEKSDNALDKVNKAIYNPDPEDCYTITISCGRLTTGTTVRPWTAVFYMKGSEMTSASTYMQTIFRVQTPYHTNDGRMKAECYVFDFAPDRSLKMMAETAKFSNRTQKGKKKSPLGGDEEDKETMKEFLSFCPVISLDGGKMVAFDEQTLFNQLDRVMIDRVVRNGFNDNALYDVDVLMTLDDNAIDKLNKMGEEIAKTTNMEKPAKAATAATLAKNGLTPEQKKKAEEAKKKKKEGKTLSPEEKAALEAERKEKEAKRKERDNRISILRGISLRIPLMIFGAEIKAGEKITIETFADLVDDASWEEFMPKGVSKADFNEFRKCYNSSRFEEAGKKIRSLTREADHLPVDERIKAIATIHSYFHNPDKETVLTPWRVVNMHLSDTLGGYCFFNEGFDGPNTVEFEDDKGQKQLVETTEPRWVDQGEVSNSIFKQVNSGGDCPVRILEINSKTGLYPLYMAYSLYRSIIPVWKYVCDDPENLSAEEQHALWDEIMQRNIFVICNTPMAARITERTLCGFRKDQEGNKIKMHIQNVELIKQAKANMDNLVKKLNGENFWFKNGEKKEMKFDAIVGNPPYQVTAGETGGKDNPIYHYFFNIAFALAPRVAFITPGRFLFDAGQTPKEWNRKMLDDDHFKVVHYWQKSNIVFPNGDIKGGVAITYRDKTQNFGKIGLFSIYQELNSIFHKVSEKEANAPMLDSMISSRGHYRFSAKAFEDYPEIPQVLGKGTGNMVASNSFQLLPQIFLETKPLKGEYIEMIGRLNNARVSRFMQKKYLEENAFLPKYNVLVPEANGTGAIGEVLSTPMIGEPMIGSTDTFISIGCFSASDEAENCLKYIKSKFCRVMLGILKITQHNPKSTWRYVPVQNFTSESDINWLKSVSGIDQQLYKKYELSNEEIKFIETNIKAME